MAHPVGEADSGDLRLNFYRRLKLEFDGSQITSDAGLLAFRELDDVLGPSQMAGNILANTRTGRNGRHGLVAQFRQSVFGRLTGYEDVNDADRLGCDPVMRFIVGGRAVTVQAASTSQMGRFETEVMTQPDNLGSTRENGAMLSHAAPPHVPTHGRTASDNPLNGLRFRLPTTQSWIGGGMGTKSNVLGLPGCLDAGYSPVRVAELTSHMGNVG